MARFASFKRRVELDLFLGKPVRAVFEEGTVIYGAYARDASGDVFQIPEQVILGLLREGTLEPIR